MAVSKFAILFVALSLAQAASVRDRAIVSPSAIAAAANVSYCFERVRGLDPERLPPSYLVLRLRVLVSYRNGGTRPLILPMERERTVYTALSPGKMSLSKEGLSLFDPTLKEMTELPAGVSPGSPVDPKNDVFSVIPADGEMAPPLLEEITLPVSRKGVFRKYPDLRGRRVYVKLRFEHRHLSPALNAHLSDQWSRFGVPWTGTLTTNNILIDVPAAPEAAPCKDSNKPAHPARDLEDMK